MRELRTPPGADQALISVIQQAREILTEMAVGTEPRRNQIFADVASLPSPTDWEGATVYIRDIGSSTPMLTYSDGTNWRRVDTNATL